MELFTPHFQGKPWADEMEVLHAYPLPRAGIDDELPTLAHVFARISCVPFSLTMVFVRPKGQGSEANSCLTVRPL